MTIICWNDSKTNQQCWETVTGSAEVAMSTWQNAHPNEKPIHHFLIQSDLLDNENVNRMAFEAGCRRHGLEPSDYGRWLLMPDNSRAIIKGLQPGRRKYVVRLWNCRKQDYTLCTPGFAKACMNRYDHQHS